MRKTIVIDASVLLKAYLPDETLRASVDSLMQDHQQGRLNLAAPLLLRYEVANALRTAAYRGRISSQQACDAFSMLVEAPLTYYDNAQLLKDALQIALRFQYSVYDSVYLALAQTLGTWCYTGDLRLYNALHPHLPYLQWIGSYKWEAIPVDSSTR